MSPHPFNALQIACEIDHLSTGSGPNCWDPANLTEATGLRRKGDLSHLIRAPLEEAASRSSRMEGAGDVQANMSTVISTFGTFADNWKKCSFLKLLWLQSSQKSLAAPHCLCSKCHYLALKAPCLSSPPLFSSLCSFPYGSNWSSHSCLFPHTSCSLGRRPLSPPDIETLSSLKSWVSLRGPPWAARAEAGTPSFSSLFAPFIWQIQAFTTVIPEPTGDTHELVPGSISASLALPVPGLRRRTTWVSTPLLVSGSQTITGIGPPTPVKPRK